MNARDLYLIGRDEARSLFMLAVCTSDRSDDDHAALMRLAWFLNGDPSDTRLNYENEAHFSREWDDERAELAGRLALR